MAQRKQRNPYSKNHNVSVKNASTSVTIPAFALVRSTGTDAQGALTVDQPSADGQDVYINGLTAILPSRYGLASKDDSLFAVYDPGSGTPVVGDAWGASAGSYLLTKGKPGFTIQSAPNTTQKIVLVSRSAATPVYGLDYASVISASQSVTAGSLFSVSWTGATFTNGSLDADPTLFTNSGSSFTINRAGVWQVSGLVQWNLFGGGTGGVGAYTEFLTQLILNADFDNNVATSAYELSGARTIYQVLPATEKKTGGLGTTLNVAASLNCSLGTSITASIRLFFTRVQ